MPAFDITKPGSCSHRSRVVSERMSGEDGMAISSIGIRRDVTVLGVDIASRSWGDIGTAILSFAPGIKPAWTVCRTDVIAWPQSSLMPEILAEVIDRFMLTTGANA